MRKKYLNYDYNCQLEFYHMDNNKHNKYEQEEDEKEEETYEQIKKPETIQAPIYKSQFTNAQLIHIIHSYIKNNKNQQFKAIPLNHTENDLLNYIKTNKCKYLLSHFGLHEAQLNSGISLVSDLGIMSVTEYFGDAPSTQDIGVYRCTLAKRTKPVTTFIFVFLLMNTASPNLKQPIETFGPFLFQQRLVHLLAWLMARVD